MICADIDPAGPAALAAELGVAVAASGEILFSDCDVLSPCALGAVFTPDTIPRLRCRAIAGAANNQLGTIDDGDALHARGIVYAADFIVSAGGIINIAGEFGGYDAERQRERTRGIEQTVGRVLALARERDISPARAADALARERIARSRRSPAAGARAARRRGRTGSRCGGCAARDPAPGQRPDPAATDRHLADHRRQLRRVPVLDRAAGRARCRATTATAGSRSPASTRSRSSTGSRPAIWRHECERPDYGEALPVGTSDTDDVGAGAGRTTPPPG